MDTGAAVAVAWVESGYPAAVSVVVVEWLL